MDIVYVYKHWWGNWLELKYSLRSLDNFPHDKVYIIWDKPDWIKWVIHIEVKDDWKKFENVRKKFMTICNNNDISEDFVLMHDDFYIMQSIKEIPYYIRWTLKEHMDAIHNKFWENDYWKAINWVYEKFPEWYSFDTHTPIALNRNKFKKILQLFPWDSWSKRSLYCNYYWIKWTRWDTKDCKVYLQDRKYIKRKWFLSSDDTSVKNMSFIRFMNQRFPSKCKYEI